MGPLLVALQVTLELSCDTYAQGHQESAVSWVPEVRDQGVAVTRYTITWELQVVTRCGRPCQKGALMWAPSVLGRRAP